VPVHSCATLAAMDEKPIELAKNGAAYLLDIAPELAELA
jgi:hypothetical protein